MLLRIHLLIGGERSELVAIKILGSHVYSFGRHILQTTRYPGFQTLKETQDRHR
jgi:hypothetical protein